MRYELFYDCGGHGGPYEGLQNAIKAAERLLNGCRTMTSIQIKKRKDACWSKIKPVVTIRKDGNEFETIYDYAQN